MFKSIPMIFALALLTAELLVSSCATQPKSYSPQDTRGGLGTITGALTDSNGRPIENTRVVLVGTTRGTWTLSDGTFTISDLPAGSYHVKIMEIYFRSIDSLITVSPNEVTHCEFKMRKLRMYPTVVDSARFSSEVQLDGLIAHSPGGSTTTVSCTGLDLDVWTAAFRAWVNSHRWRATWGDSVFLVLRTASHTSLGIERLSFDPPSEFCAAVADLPVSVFPVSMRGSRQSLWEIIIRSCEVEDSVQTCNVEAGYSCGLLCGHGYYAEVRRAAGKTYVDWEAVEWME